MKKIIFLLLSLAFTSGQAQKCKYDVDKTDAFSGKKTLGTTAKLPNGALIGFNLSDGKFWIGMFINFFGEKNEKISHGDSLLFKLGNGEILSFYTNDVYAPTSYVNGSGAYANVSSYYKPNYDTDSVTIRKMAQYPVTDMKIYMGANNLPVAVDEKYREKVMKAAGCILK
jgi:hypothetical protein